MSRFANASDREVCRQIHRKFGTTYYYSTMRFPKAVREHVHAIYAFVRVPDEWVDNPGQLTISQRRELLEEWRESLSLGLNGVRPARPEMRAFVDAVRMCQIPLSEANLFLDAMAADLTTTRYESYEALRGYMRGSAAAVGVMMGHAMGAEMDDRLTRHAVALAEAMQLTNFLRDVREDYERGRIYLPLDEMRQFGVQEMDLANHCSDGRFRELMQFQIDRARGLFSDADAGILALPSQMRPAVLMARLLYCQILDQIEAMNYDVFRARARTTALQKIFCAVTVSVSSERVINSLMRKGRAA